MFPYTDKHFRWPQRLECYAFNINWCVHEPITCDLYISCNLHVCVDKNAHMPLLFKCQELCEVAFWKLWTRRKFRVLVGGWDIRNNLLIIHTPVLRLHVGLSTSKDSTPIVFLNKSFNRYKLYLLSYKPSFVYSNCCPLSPDQTAAFLWCLAGWQTPAQRPW